MDAANEPLPGTTTNNLVRVSDNVVICNQVPIGVNNKTCSASGLTE
jgi:hypothetical protein